MFKDDITPIQIGRVREWISALKSGKYKQSFGNFKNIEENSYCALGLGIEISKLSGNFKMGELLDFYGCETFKPETQTRNYKQKSINTLNDREKLPFSEIANLIEQELNQHLEKIGYSKISEDVLEVKEEKELQHV